MVTLITTLLLILYGMAIIGTCMSLVKADTPRQRAWHLTVLVINVLSAVGILYLASH